MTNLDLVANVADLLGSTKKDADACIEAVVATIVNHLVKEGSVKVKGLGTLNVKHRPARKGVNPATGAAIEVPAVKVISFKPSSAVKDAVNK